MDKTAGTWIRTWEDGPAFSESLDGVNWTLTPRPPWWKRLVHRHTVQTHTHLGDGCVMRCWCGAVAMGEEGGICAVESDWIRVWIR